MRNLVFSAVSLAIVSCLSAQDPTHGNGIPSAYVENTPGVLGGVLTVGYGSPSTPNSIAVVGVSAGFTLTQFPFPQLGGPLAIDAFDPSYQIFFFGLDANGHGATSLPLPPNFAPAASPPLFVHALTFESPTQWSVSKTARIDWMVPNTFEAAGALQAARQMHSATALGSGPRDNATEVLICGGATGSFMVPAPIASAELFVPLTRTTTALPSMSLPRSLHRAVRLDDGRVLITGGATTGGVVTATCEFFDPATRTFAPAPAMGSPRAGHALTLLDDGRVLATGGVSDWQNAATNFIAALNTAQDSAELFDPIANTWTPLSPMANRRLGHAQVKLPNGEVLILSGIAGGFAGSFGGGQMPFYASSCEIFSPATLSYRATAPLVFNGSTGPFGTATTRSGTAFAGASLLPNGSVLVTGGFSQITVSSLNNESSEPHPFTGIWQNDAWTQGPLLPIGVAFHDQATQGNGALVFGGVTRTSDLLGTNTVAFVTATQALAKAPLPSARGMQTVTRLWDGTLLVYGGGQWPATLGDGAIYQPE